MKSAILLLCLMGLSVGFVSHAQAESVLSPGDRVIVVSSALPVYLQPKAVDRVVEEMIPGMTSRIVKAETDADGASWYYLSDNAHAWVPAEKAGQATLIPYSDDAMHALIAEATDAIKRDAKDAEAYLKRGEVYGSLGQFDQAFADIDTVVALIPDEARYYDYRAKLALDAYQPEKALTDAKKAIVLGRKLGNTYNRLGIAYLNLRQYGQARIAFTQATFVAPTYGLLYNNLGNAFVREQNDSTAPEYYGLALSYDPLLGLAHSNRALLLIRLNRRKEALGDLEQGLAIDPHCGSCHYVRGIIAGNYDGNPAAALFEYAAALADDPDDVAYLAGHATSYLQLGLFSEAAADYAKALQLDPSRGDIAFNLGAAYMEAGQYTQAVDAYTAAIDAGCPMCSSYAYIHRAEANLDAGRYDDAIADVKIYINAFGRSNNYATALIISGTARLYKKDYHDAANDFAVAVIAAERRDFVYNYVTEGFRYRVSETLAANIPLLKIEALSDTTGEKRYQLAVLEMEYGHWEDAKRDFELYFEQLGQPIPDDLARAFNWLLNT